MGEFCRNSHVKLEKGQPTQSVLQNINEKLRLLEDSVYVMNKPQVTTGTQHYHQQPPPPESMNRHLLRGDQIMQKLEQLVSGQPRINNLPQSYPPITYAEAVQYPQTHVAQGQAYHPNQVYHPNPQYNTMLSPPVTH